MQHEWKRKETLTYKLLQDLTNTSIIQCRLQMHESELCISGEMALTFESQADSLSTQGHKCENNNKMYINGMEWQGMEQWQAFVNTAMNTRFH